MTTKELKSYLERAVAGESDVIWPGLPLYFCKTSGTTSGQSIFPLQRLAYRTTLMPLETHCLHRIVGSGDASFVSGKMIFIAG